MNKTGKLYTLIKYSIYILKGSILMSKIEVINLTPHDVTFFTKTDLSEKIVFNASGINARCKQTNQYNTTINGNIRLTETVFGEIEDLPDPQENTFYIVSRIVREAAKERNDLLVPNEIVRNEDNQIIGCLSFAVN